MARAADCASPGIRLLTPFGEAVDLVERDDCATVFVREFRDETATYLTDPEEELRVDQVVLATGVEFRSRRITENVASHSRYVRNQFSQVGQARIAQVEADRPVVVIGSSLSAFDAAVTLLDQGHRGPIHLISRNGITPGTYPADHTHEVVSVRRPPFVNRPYRGRNRLIVDLMREWRFLLDQLGTTHPEIDSTVLSERILKAWEPYLPELTAQMPPGDVRAFLELHESRIARLRVSAMAETTRRVEAAMPGQVTVTAASLVDIDGLGDDLIRVRIRDKGGHESDIEAALVISNLAREFYYDGVISPIWQNLIHRRRLAVPHRRTGRGVEVGEHGELVAASGVASRFVSVVGVPREGDEIARNGRLAAFAINLASIKNQSVTTAVNVLDRIERPRVAAGGPAASIESGADDAAAIVESAAVGLGADVDRAGIAAAVREQLPGLTEAHLQLFCATGRDARDAAIERIDAERALLLGRVLRLGAGLGKLAEEVVDTTVDRAKARSTGRMTDVSMTPKALGEQLAVYR